MIEFITDALVCTAAVGALIFMIRYARTGWWRNAAGRGVMAFMGGACLLLALVVVGTVLGPEYPGREFVRLGAYGVLNAMLWFAVAGLVKVQRRK